MSNETITEEKRRFRRVPLGIQATLSDGDRHFDCQILDISLKGVLLQPTHPETFQVGQNFDMEITLAENDTAINMHLSVAHVTGTQIGLTCQEIDADSMIHLRRLLELNLGDASLIDRDIANLGCLSE